LADLLVEREVIFAEDAEKIFGKRPWASRSEEILEPIHHEEEATVAPENAEKAEDVEPSENPVATEPVENEESPKPKRPRKRKPEGLFEGFDFEQTDENTEK
jgi:cell division protease FtsH